MVVHLALGVKTARALARVHAVLVDTGQGLGAVGGHQTLGPAVGWCAVVAHDAGAHRLDIVTLALGVRAARVRKTGIHLDRRLWCCSYRRRK